MTDATTTDELNRMRHRAERERRARQEAESIAEQSTLLLYQRQQQLQVLQMIADAANAAVSIDAAVQFTLDQICAYTGWPIGHAYFVAEEPDPVLVPTLLWHFDHEEQFRDFRQITEATRFRLGEGLPGGVWESRDSLWVVDVTQYENFPRARHVASVGVRGAFAFPVYAGGSIRGVLEFFSRESVEPHKMWLEVANQVGIQLGHVFERMQAQRELEHMHRQLLGVSRQAGMAEVATSVIHNVGNVLNSVNVSASLVLETLRSSKMDMLARTAALIEEHHGDIGSYVTSDPKGRLVPPFIVQLASVLQAEHEVMVKELAAMSKHVEHVKEIVAMQQSYASISGVIETVNIPELIEDALSMNAGALARHMIETVRDFAKVPPIAVERHKVLQILVNLIRNAKYACHASDRTDKRLILRITNGEARVKISIIDNGVGIPHENLTRIFGHGFTTKKDGHGFGLHSGANAANEMGGQLTAHSDGPGCGATFTLALPLAPPA